MTPIHSAQNMGVSRTISALRARVDQWKNDGLRVALVPTMGALHAGHLSLVTHASRLADRTVASIFVNPAQFAPHEDLKSYPRDEQDDLEKLKSAGCHLAFIPEAAAVYPPGFQTAITVEDIAQGLCGASRPHFFGGVATVVCKLLNQCRPDIAVFGEKDFQQLLVIRRMVRDLDMDVDIVGAPIVREADGLAMSSRNAYLTAEERAIAPGLHEAITNAATALAQGARIADALADAGAYISNEQGMTLDYMEVRQTEPFVAIGPGPLADYPGADARIFAAAQLGRTRLIDNIAIQ